jgi:hypothetical protein
VGLGSGMHLTAQVAADLRLWLFLQYLWAS